MIHTNKQYENRLLFWGITLFLLGLLAGLGMPLYSNTRMGLSAHLEGVLNGIFLMVLGLIWTKIKLSAKQLSIVYVLSLYAGFANFGAVTMGALTGGGKMMPLANGQDKGILTEGIISFLLISLTIALLIACLLIMTGLYKNMKKIHLREQ